MRFEKSPGAPIRPEDAPILGREFIRIATEHKINDLRALTKELVLEEVLADKKHVLRRFYNWDLETAAHAHWLERTQTLLNSVRIIEANVHPRKARKMFMAVNDFRRSGEDKKDYTHRRMRILAPDAAKHDDIFVKCLEGSIKRISQALKDTEEWAERGTVPPKHGVLLASLRATFDAFEQQ